MTPAMRTKPADEYHPARDGGVMSERWVLAIDFGTSFTSAAMVSDGRVEVLEIDGVRRLPSVVLWLDDQHDVGAAPE
jgi:molecular chaperone DnaK (HSP70)